MAHEELFADRFVVGRDRRAIDLASGAEVELIESTAGGPSDQRRWIIRCDWLLRLRHRAIAALVDYGLVGERRRFEAWRCGPPWAGAPQEARRQGGHAGVFLRANHLTGIDPEVRACLGSYHSYEGSAVVLPAADAGYPMEGSAEVPEVESLDVFGLRTVSRPAVAAIGELFEDVHRQKPSAVSLGGAPGAGIGVAINDLSRAARLNGFVPLGPGAYRWANHELLRDRSLFVIADSEHPLRGWREFLQSIVRTPKPHVLLFAGQRRIARLHSAWLDRLPEDVLAGAVLPEPSSRWRHRIEAAARRADGLPGRFAAALWGMAPRPRTLPRTALIAAETSAKYGDDAPASETAHQDSSPWPAPGELAMLRRRLHGAVALVNSGRHAPGERLLRSAVAALSRRHDWQDAAHGTITLAAALLRRGRPREAQSLLDDARAWCRKAELDGPMLDVARLSGTAWIDLGRLDEAENVLSAALTAARSNDEPRRTAEARLVLARCQFWRARYEEAGRTLSENDAGGVTVEMAIRRALALSRIAVGNRQLDAGVSGALAALESAENSRNEGLIAEAACGAAFAHLATGDRAAVAGDVARSVRAARAARDPLRALGARLLLAESERRAGRPAAATTLVRRVATLPPGSLPATIRARSALLSDLLSGSPPTEIVKRHVAATGLWALTLFAPGANRSSDCRAGAREVIEILELCQSALDDRETLSAVCAQVRRQLRAAAVAFFTVDDGTVVPVVSDGARLEAAIASRALATGQVLMPHGGAESVDGAAPVRYGGRSIGALAARWTFGASCDLDAAWLILTTAAAAAAPALAGVLARRQAARPQGERELLGVSSTMHDVRQAIERAAAAPFAVLVEGESGSGKELVARALHRRSPRRDRPFCTLNCAALPDDLVESELFGHARGAFTGAIADRPGVFEEAHTGSIFLDEVGELSPRAQAKLLRTIQENEIRRVGENVPRRIDVRIVSATNRNLREEAAAGRFRRDLLYRLDVVRIVLPALRERREDIAILVERFWKESADRIGSRAVLSAATVAALARYDWPGNVREVQNVLAALAVRCPRRGIVQPSALPACFDAARTDPGWRLEDARKMFEERFIRAALVRTGGHRRRAADELGISRQGLTKLMKRLGITDAWMPAVDAEPPLDRAATAG